MRFQTLRSGGADRGRGWPGARLLLPGRLGLGEGSSASARHGTPPRRGCAARVTRAHAQARTPHYGTNPSAC